MTTTEKNQRIAERLGWRAMRLVPYTCKLKTHYLRLCGINPKTNVDEPCPNYFTDLNAMHEAAMALREKSPLQYVHYSAKITAIVAKFNSDLESKFSMSAHDATASQRAEAFGLTLGLWKEGE